LGDKKLVKYAKTTNKKKDADKLYKKKANQLRNVLQLAPTSVLFEPPYQTKQNFFFRIHPSAKNIEGFIFGQTLKCTSKTVLKSGLVKSTLNS
jgi:hypothetical protein